MAQQLTFDECMTRHAVARYRQRIGTASYAEIEAKIWTPVVRFACANQVNKWIDVDGVRVRVTCGRIVSIGKRVSWQASKVLQPRRAARNAWRAELREEGIL